VPNYYAKGTTVSPEKSRAEIEGLLRRFGATQFVSGWDGEKAILGFTACGRQIRFVLMLPKVEEFETTDGRVKASAEKRWEQACAERWRALALIIKAKLEAVQQGISTFEDEFLAQTVLPDGGTISRWIQPQLASVYATGHMPPLLSAGPN